MHQLAGLERSAGPKSILAMSNASKPDDATGEPLDSRVRALIALRDELRALNARLEYVALMLRLARSQLTK
jgi:hypothetical protein